jgi:hypothetical protein
VRTVLVSGTHGWRGDASDRRAWFAPDSPFVELLNRQGAQPVFTPERQPFVWSTDLGGVGVGRGRVAVWSAAGMNLYWYCVPPLCPESRIPGDELAVVTHSHGMQVALFAAAAGLQIHTLITVSGPVRRDMHAVAAQARPNIRFWLHIYSAGDWWQRLGALFDGQIGWAGAHPLADRNDVALAGAGHTGVLNDARYMALWLTRGWARLLT